MSRQRLVVAVDVEVAETPAHLLMAVGVERLVAEEDHLVVQERPAQSIHLLIRERIAEIDAADLRAERTRYRPNLDAVGLHGAPPLSLRRKLTLSRS